MKGKTLSFLLAIWMISAMFVSLAMNARAADNFQNNATTIALTSNNYPGGVAATWYYPGDAITGTLTGVGGPDTIDDTFDVVAADDDGIGACNPVVLADIRLQDDNVVIDQVTGTGTFTFDGSATQYLSDGYYCAWVAPGDYIQGGPIGPYRGTPFQIHEYRIVANLDRGGYIPGNTVKVYYSVSRIKDGSPMTMTGYDGNWLIQSTAGGETYDYEALTDPAGQFSFTISNTGGISPGDTYPIYIWFNSTTGGAVRRATWQGTALVGNLDTRILTPGGPGIYDAGSLMFIEVATEVIVPGPNPRYPGASVQIKILDGPTPTSPELTAYTETFTSDGQGLVDYTFILDTAVFLDGKTYTISANSTSVLKYDSDLETFTARKTLETMSVQVTLDKYSYYSGESVVVTVAAQPPAGHSQPSTYVYKITSGTAVYAQELTIASPYTFQIPIDFTGTMTFRADVYNTEGDYGWDSVDGSVVFGVMIVNVHPAEYNANDQLTADFELKSSVMTGATTTFYYEIYDGVRNVKQGAAVVDSGSLKGSIQYTVPNVPAQSYEFWVYANGGGHLIYNSATAYLISEFILTIKFDKNGYNPGDTMTVEYKMSARASGTPLPRIFSFQYGLVGYPMVDITTTDAEGKVTYVVPSGANEGQTLFGMTEVATGTAAVEVVTIGPAPSEISLFDAFLLVLIVILFLLVLAMRGRGAGAGAGAPKPKEEKVAPPPPPGQQTSPMIVNCKACGAPIEITTSKRPIEVMCPSCGETAMVQ